MKIIKTILPVILIFSGTLLLSCDKTTNDENTCGDSANQHWSSITASFIGIDFGNAQFKLEVSATNMCIYKDVEIDIHIAEKDSSTITSVNAFAVLPNSNTPDLIMMHHGLPSLYWQNELYGLNLRQSYSSNPGSFLIWVYIYIPATSEFNALQKYASSVDVTNSYINVLYNRPK